MSNKFNTPIISIIVPIYKTEIYLKQCVDSILAQSLTDIEIILVDDGSPDNCPAICDEYAEKDKRVKVIHQQNGGYGKACNTGFNAATGEYIGIVESDDYIEQDMYETLYSAVQDDHCPIIKGSFFREYQDGTKDICSLSHITNNQLQCEVNPKDNIKLMIHDTSIWAAIYNRDFIFSNKIKMLETKGASFQDDVWKFETFAVAECIILIDKPVYHYRYMREGSSCAGNENFNAIFDNFNEIKRFLLTNNIYEQYKNSYYIHYIYSARFNYYRFDEKERKRFIMEMRKVIENAKEENIDIETFTDIPLIIKDFYYQIISTMQEKTNTSGYKKIIAVVQVQNESDIIESLCRYYCSFCDGIIVIDDKSSDNTSEILNLLVNEGLPVYLPDKNEIDHGYDNMNGRNQQFHLAVDRYDADLILPIDADEFLVNVNGGNPRLFLESLDEKIEYHIPWRNYVYSKDNKDNSVFYPSIAKKYAEPSFSKAIISRYLLKQKKAFPETGCHSFYYPEDTPVVLDVKELCYNHYAFRSVYHFMLKIITSWAQRLTFPYHDGSTYFSEAFHYKEFYEEIKKYGIIPEEMLEKYSTYIEFPFPKDKDYQLKENNFDISFCENKLKLRYTNYKINENDFIKMLSIQLEKNLRNMPSWRSSLERKVAGEQLGQANATIANLHSYIEILKKQGNQKDQFYTFACVIFIDSGSGFVSDEYMTVPMNKQGNKFDIEINIKTNVKGIRFDPFEGYACVISNMQIITDNGEIEYTYTNGININNVILFDTTDPQVAVYFNDKATSKVRIAGDIYRYNFEEISLLSRCKLIFEQYLKIEDTNKALITERNNLIKERDILTIERNGLITERDKLINELNRLIAERNALTAERNALTAERNALTAERNALIAERNALTAERDGMINSRSWRITKPLRLFVKGCLLIKNNGIKATFKRVYYYFKQNTIKKTRKKNIFSLNLFIKEVKIFGGTIFGKKILDKWNADNSAKKILLISHELNLTGAPIALYYFAENLKKNGYCPIIISPNDGSLRSLLLKENFPVIVYNKLYVSDLILQYASLFKLLIVNTIVGAPIISALNGKKIPILWWIHEANVSYHEGVLSEMPEHLKENIHVYCAGPYAVKVLQKFRSDYKTEQFLYHIPDYTKSLPKRNLFRIKFAKGKCIFAVIGAQEERKGQDILIQAIRMLPLEQLKKCLFIFIGRKWYPPIMQNILKIIHEYPQNIQFINELDRMSILSLYQQIDCLICPSKDDPMPVVVTEAMLMSKIIICSENTGSAKLLEQMNAGLIYRNNSPEELTGQIQFVLENRLNLSQMREQARKTYENYFSQNTFNDSVEKILQKLIRGKDLPYNGTVSVIIPTYNAGEEFRFLIELLKSQTGIGKIEIIIVDSGSSDGTPELAEKMGAVVLRIAQNEFSHSFARNLGAKNATGEYLLFMTQDALPTDNTWIQSLMKPILQDNVVAVSCRETPKPECDLLGRISNWIHNEYMGILQSDRIMQLPEQNNYENIRKNAQLNDVANLIRKDIFTQFWYQGNYAEDLDLGIRLIQAGYQLSLLSSVQVIHSHTRPAVYHLKRNIVDNLALKKILPDYPMQRIDAQTTVNRIITAYCITIYMTRYLTETCDTNESVSEFFKRIEKYYNHVLSIMQNTTFEELKDLMEEDTKIFDSGIKIFIQKLLTIYNIAAYDPAISADQFNYIINIVPRYLNIGTNVFSKKFKEEISDLLVKLYGIISGCHLAFYYNEYYQEKNSLNELIREYAEGI